MRKLTPTEQVAVLRSEVHQLREAVRALRSPSQIKQVLTMNEVAERYGVGRTTVYSWVDRCGLPEGRLVNGKRFWNLKELEEWETRTFGQLAFRRP